MKRTFLALAAVVALAAVSAPVPAQFSTYTEANLGYPVPVPEDRPDAFEGFRTYNGLRTRLDALLLEYGHISEFPLGTTIDGRAIYGYVIGDGDGLAVDGAGPEPAFLVNGTIHAREWASPEIVMAVMEHLCVSYGSDPVATYLVDQLQLGFIPVQNVDGFLQTQRTPATNYASQDGRMRRKNMRGVDEDVFNTTSDNRNGVDLNRNLPVGWGSFFAFETSDTWYGTAPASEPESLALQAAPTMFTSTDRLRGYFDVHGAIPALIVIGIGEPGVDALTTELSGRMQAAYRARNGVPTSYPVQFFTLAEAIGATDEYFASTYQIPGFTIEYPTPRFRVPGSGPTFILPDDEVGEVVDENFWAIHLGFLMAAGPPILEAVELWADLDGDAALEAGERLYRAAWQPDGSGGRELVVDEAASGPVPARDDLVVVLQFNKPMRRDDPETPGAVPALWPGQSGAVQPAVSFHVETVTRGGVAVPVAPVGDGWLLDPPGGGDGPSTLRYGGDTWMGSVDLASVAGVDFGQPAGLSVAVNDLYGFALDAGPATVVDWDAGWTGYEDGEGTNGAGGEDTSFVVPIAEQASVPGWQGFWIYGE